MPAPPIEIINANIQKQPLESEFEEFLFVVPSLGSTVILILSKGQLKSFARYWIVLHNGVALNEKFKYGTK